jgi:hypothetical protein
VARNEAVAKAQREKFIEAARKTGITEPAPAAEPDEPVDAEAEDNHQPQK